MKIGAGVEVGPYHVIEQIGRGGMATVFKAYQAALERYVAIKVLPEFLAEDEQFRERFRREAVAVAKLRHPGILSVFDHGEFEGQPYIVTEFVEGGTFADQLGGKPLTVQQALEVLQPIAAAIDYAHERGILHRDIKPSNILITKEGAPVLGDFGLARMMASNERLTRLDSVVGTPEYMSPEQCMGKETGPASDRYSFGVVAFEALTGHVPFQAETPAAVMIAQMQAPLPDPRVVNPAINENVERALLRALSKDPENRFQSCSAFVRALAATDTPVAQTRAAEATPTLAAAAPVASVTSAPTPTPAPTGALAPSPALPRRVGRGRGLVIAGVVLIVLLALGGVLYAINAGRGSTHTSTATSSPSPATGGVKHGSQVYSAGLSAKDWDPGSPPSPDPTGSISLAYPGSSIDFKINQKDGSIGLQLDAPALKNYVANIVFKADQGSDLEFDWDLRNTPSGSGNIFLSFEVSQETMTLWLSPNDGSSNQPLTAALNVPGLQSGTTVDLWMAVSGDNIQLYLGTKKVADVTESTVTGAATPNLYLQGQSGAIHILVVKYYTVS